MYSRGPSKYANFSLLESECLDSEKVWGRAVKVLRGIVTLHEVEGLAYLQRSPTGRTIARKNDASGTSSQSH